jgi:hypothetical protein
LYLNPGISESNKQVLTPLQLILKASAMKTASAAAACDESVDKAAAKAKYLGELGSRVPDSRAFSFSRA